MDVRLVLIEGGKTVTVRPRLPTVIGRNTQADVQVPDTQVSRRHCELYDFEGQLAVRDIGSVNGTLVNGHRIEQDTFLSTGDTLSIGRISFRVEVDAAHPEINPPSDEPTGQTASDSGVMVEPEEEGSSVINYKSSDAGSFIGISGVDAADDEDNGDDGLTDFLKGLGG
jgi:pSer/pThr/pTyr-binding forkhead associated (FHA) protein